MSAEVQGTGVQQQTNAAEDQQAEQEPNTTSVGQPMTGPLPSDFLRVLSSAPTRAPVSPTFGIVHFFLIDAVLDGFNPGIFFKKDVYVNLKVGSVRLVSGLCEAGDTTPVWNQRIDLPMQSTDVTLLIEIKESKVITDDNVLAYTAFNVHRRLLRGEATSTVKLYDIHDNSKQVGLLRFSLVYTPLAWGQVSSMIQRHSVAEQGGQRPPAQQTTQQQQQHPQEQQQQAGQQDPAQTQEPIEVTDEMVDQVTAMFPDSDKTVVKELLIANNGNVEATVNQMLSS
eukprot:Clim_evm39s227 gene=Clim_evmTU39s227